MAIRLSTQQQVPSARSLQPHTLSAGRLLVVVSLALTLLATGPVQALAATEGPVAAEHPPQVLLLHRLLNAERVRAGVDPLELDDQLSALARSHALEMVELRYYSHFSPVTGSPLARARGAGLEFRRLGENIAAGWTAAWAHRALTRSPSHYANMLSPIYESVGLAAVPAPPYWYVVQVFVAWPVATVEPAATVEP